jgi:hypothetical protein
MQRYFVPRKGSDRAFLPLKHAFYRLFKKNWRYKKSGRLKITTCKTKLSCLRNNQQNTVKTWPYLFLWMATRSSQFTNRSIEWTRLAHLQQVSTNCKVKSRTDTRNTGSCSFTISDKNTIKRRLDRIVSLSGSILDFLLPRASVEKPL